MPKVTIEFHLPEEQAEYDTAVKANDMASAIYDIITKLRERNKYVSYKTDAEQELIATVYNEVWDILTDHKIDPYG